jgi:uncharacterized membrane protein
MVEEIVGTIVERWYVTAYGVVFVILALRHLGLKCTVIYTAVAVAVGALAENGSVHLGVPFTRYAFNPDLRGHELWVGDVPLMVPLSYTFMAYFAFAAARLIVAGPYSSRSRQPVLEYVLAVVLATWALWIIDPVSRLGRYFALGELFRYDGPGFWFGLPLGSQVGFLFTSGTLIGLLTWMARNEPADVVPRLRTHPHLPALVTYLLQVGFMAGVAFVVARTTNDAAVAAIADALAGASLIIGIPMALLTAVYWRSLRSVANDRPSQGSTSDGPSGRETLGKCV